MPGKRWRVASGPGLIVLVALAGVAASSQAALSAWDGPRASAGVAPIVPGCAMPTAGEAWYQLDERSDAAGALLGYTLRYGATGAAERELALPPESSVAGPFGGVLLVAADDRQRSDVRLVVAATGCGAVVASSDAVIRRTTLGADGRVLYYHAVERQTRRDLGIRRRELETHQDVLSAAPSPVPDGDDRVFSTEFAWSRDGTSLAIQSCSAVACRTRVLDIASGRVQSIATTSGEIVGLTETDLVSYAACRGLPCGVLATSRQSGEQRVLAPAADNAVLGYVGDRPTLAYEVPGDRAALVALDVASRTSRRFATQARLLGPPTRALAAAETPDGFVVLAGSERLRSASSRPLLLRLRDGITAAWKGQ